MIDLLLLVLAALIGAVIYALIVKALPGKQPGEDQFAKIEQAIRDAAAKAQEASNKANTASIIAAQAATKVEAAAAAVAQPKPPEPPPPVPEPAPPAPVPAPPATPAPIQVQPAALQVVYANRDALLAALTGYQYAVMLDNAPVHVGFGPPDIFWTHPNGMVSQTKPEGDTEIVIEGT